MRSTLLIVVLVAPAGWVFAQAPPRAAPSPASVDPSVQLMLIRNSLALVNHANLTGNYTVLRDLSSPQFRQRITAADLAATFADLRRQKFDLSPVLVIQPHLTQEPQIAGDRLQLIGEFPTRPQTVQFALAFQLVEGGWMIDEISLRVAPAADRLPALVGSGAAYPPTGAASLPTGADRTAIRGGAASSRAGQPR